MDYIRLDNDSWEDAGKKYKLVSLYRHANSTATDLVLEYEGNVTKRTVAYHQIEWLES